MTESSTAGIRIRGVDLQRVRPTRWLWERRIPIGLPSLFVGEEGIGKGTLAAWLIARATCGELPGDLAGEPIRVLIVGDEDSFEPIWVPRLYAAGADLAMVRTRDDGEYIDDFEPVQADLAAAIADERIGLVVLDALIDHVPGGQNGEAIYNPKAVRQALKPLRRLLAEQELAGVGLLHPTKGKPHSFRDLVAGSHQFNAVSRSSMLLAKDPADDTRRVLVRGKGNHSAAPRSVEFTIASEVFELNGHTFEMPKVVELEEGDRTIDDLLKSMDAPVRTALAAEIEQVLTNEPQTLADIARSIGRSPKDGSVRNALTLLLAEGKAKKVDGGWRKP